MNYRTAEIGNLVIGHGCPIAIQTMCNTHTYDIAATLSQCRELAAAGSQLIRITVPGTPDVGHIKAIHDTLRAEGIDTPIVADIHFSSRTAIEVAPYVEKVRINPGNFNRDHDIACQQFRTLISVCKQHGTAIRIGVNHGSLGPRITSLYGNTPFGMASAAMEWIRMCQQQDFHNIVVSLKSSNTVVMVQAYRELRTMMEADGNVYPLHVGLTEAGNGDSGRIKSAVAISTLLEEGLGDTIRVSLTEPPVDELPVAAFIAERFSSPGTSYPLTPKVSQREAFMLESSCLWGPKLMNRTADEPDLDDEYLRNEIMQAARRRFYKPEYIACPGCGRTMYNLQDAFEEVKRRTSHLSNVVIAVMGCIVNGPGEMADADWGYVGEGGGKVSIYRKNEPVLTHVPQEEAADRLVQLIEDWQRQSRQPQPSDSK